MKSDTRRITVTMDDGSILTLSERSSRRVRDAIEKDEAVSVTSRIVLHTFAFGEQGENVQGVKAHAVTEWHACVSPQHGDTVDYHDNTPHDAIRGAKAISRAVDAAFEEGMKCARRGASENPLGVSVPTAPEYVACPNCGAPGLAVFATERGVNDDGDGFNEFGTECRSCNTSMDLRVVQHENGLKLHWQKRD